MNPRCVSKCTADNSIVSYTRRDKKFYQNVNVPYCAYCGENCVDCREDKVDGHLWCAKCASGFLAYGTECVVESVGCPYPAVQRDRMCIDEDTEDR